jgi:hypothetical protein
MPDDKAHRANDEALSARDATASRTAFERDLRAEIEHPVHTKIVDALQSRRLALYGLLTLALLAVLWWEWKISRDIYEVTLPVSPWIPFSVFVSLAFLASALLAEGIPAFSLGFSPPRTAGPDKATSAIESLYDRRKTRTRRGGPASWLLMGIVVAALVEGAIYFLSAERVKLMTAAGEIPDGLAEMQIWLPVILFAIDIALGLPAFFVVLTGYHTLRLRRRRAMFTILRDQEIVLQRSAVKQYTDYMGDWEAYNRWATQRGMGERLLVPPCSALRALLVDDYGHDPTRSDATPRPESPGQVSTEVTSHDGPVRPAGDDAAPGSAETGRDNRVDELLNLVDEQIAKSNRSI